jgi:hypothetical protein
MRRRSAYLFVVVAMTTSASAPRASDGVGPQRTSADRLCDSYGPGFVPSGTAGNCVKVKERLRVEPHGRRGLSPLDNGSAYAPLPLQDEGALPAHLRLNGGFGGAGLR